MQLDERHRRFAEEKIKGTPLTKIADLVGVTRNTLYEWQKHPVWQAYYSALVTDVEKARAERLVPVIAKSVGLLGDLLDHYRAEVETGTIIDGEGRPHRPDVPSIESVARVTEKLVGMQRVASGEPSAITESRTTPAAKSGDAVDDRAQSVLDGAFPSGARPASSLPGDEPPKH